MPIRVLLVEDDIFMTDLISGRMLKEGFLFDSATETKDGYELIKKNIPDVILLDLLLPGENGFEMLTKLKKGDETKSIPVIILSNLGGEEEIKRAKELGAASYLIKSNVLLDDVVAAIKEVVGKIQKQNPIP